jgi:uncharacterized protein (TIGR02757 family)
MLAAMVQNLPTLGTYLERLAGDYGPDYLRTDPLGEVRRFTDPGDLEVAAFLAAGLSFGRVDLILAHLRDLWGRLDDSPARTADRWRPADRRRLDGFVHRWVGPDDLARVLFALGRARRGHGSLRALFLTGYDPADPDLGPSLSRFVRALRGHLPRTGSRRAAQDGELPQGVRTFFADPARGGACKRLNLFLRWMVRGDDGLDLGLFTPVRPDQLVIPLDTHVARISRNLGLSERRTPDWKMAAGITRELKRWDARDPVRFDFAISRLGILGNCPRRVNRVKCAACALVPVCTLGRSHHGRP